MTVEYSTPLKIVPGTGLKIYDITHADANEHSVGVPAGYPANTKALIVYVIRVAGAGTFRLRSVSGVAESLWNLSHATTGVWIRAIDGNFYYQLSQANDDWDIYAVGYMTE